MLGCLVWSVADGGDNGACAKAAENIRPLSAVVIMSFFIIENLLWRWIDGWGSSRTTEIVPLEENARGGRAFLAISGLRGPRIIATDRQAPRIYSRMIPLCSRFDSVLFTPKTSAIASY